MNHMKRSRFEPGTYLDEGPVGWDAGSSLTRRDRLLVDPQLLVNFSGRKGEERLFANRPSGRKTPAQWRRFVESVAKGVRDPVTIHVEPDGTVLIHEGNHRIRAAIEAGVMVPVEISYFGNSQRRGLVVEPEVAKRTSPLSSIDRAKRPVEPVRRRQRKPYRWALYDGQRLAAEGESDGRGNAAGAAILAMYADAEAVFGDAFRYGANAARDALTMGYRWSLWGPRGGNLVHMKPVGTGTKRRRR